MAAIDDAKRFLFLHPWSTTDVDNPVRLLEDLVKDFYDNLAEAIADFEAEAFFDFEADDKDDQDRVQRLIAFVKGLRDDLKISEAEYQIALQCID